MISFDHLVVIYSSFSEGGGGGGGGGGGEADGEVFEEVCGHHVGLCMQGLAI